MTSLSFLRTKKISLNQNKLQEKYSAPPDLFSCKHPHPLQSLSNSCFYCGSPTEQSSLSLDLHSECGLLSLFTDLQRPPSLPEHFLPSTSLLQPSHKRVLLLQYILPSKIKWGWYSLALIPLTE